MEFPSPLHLVSLNVSVTMVHLSKLKTDMGTVLLPEPQALSGSHRVIHNGLLLFRVPIQERTESPRLLRPPSGGQVLRLSLRS